MDTNDWQISNIEGTLGERHPRPWRLAYDPTFPGEWHECSCVHIVDANGEFVLRPPQFVNHPGLFDEQASLLCTLIVASVNCLHERTNVQSSERK